jgi:excisionase family DNA binding protein
MVRSKKKAAQPEAAKGPETKRIAYTVNETARMFGRTRGTIYNWVKTGVLREIKVPGGLGMIEAESVADLIEGRTQLKSIMTRKAKR